MTARTRMFLLVAWLVALSVIATMVSCKEAATRSVTIDLGLANRGSAGFSCTENPSAVCGAVLECSVRNPAREGMNQCLAATCIDAGAVAPDCTRLVGCLKSDAGTVAECYDRTCRVSPPLAARALDAGGGLHLYVDYVRLGGTPGCRASELRAWCASEDCRVARRRCVALDIDPSSLGAPESAMRAISDGFGKARVLDDDAPDEPIVVRIVGVPKSGPCSAGEEDVADASIGGAAVGCAYSCPTVLTAATGAITVDLDLLGSACVEHDIAACVTLFHNDAGQR